jgi:hypothetical protein
VTTLMVGAADDVRSLVSESDLSCRGRRGVEVSEERFGLRNGGDGEAMMIKI